MRFLFAYDGSESADTAIATAGMLLGRDNADAVVLTVSFGSVSAHVFQHASRPVLVVPPAERYAVRADPRKGSQDSAERAIAAKSDRGRWV